MICYKRSDGKWIDDVADTFVYENYVLNVCVYIYIYIYIYIYKERESVGVEK